jgi:hypothetical protein
LVSFDVARGLPPQIEGERVDRFAVRMSVKRLQHEHRVDYLARDRRTATPRREQVGEQLAREQPASMLGQQRKHAAPLE